MTAEHRDSHPRISPEQWDQVKKERPDIIEGYARLPLSLVVERRHDTEGLIARKGISLLGLAEEWTGIDGTTLPLGQLAAKYNLSPSGVHALASAVVGCISEDTGLPLHYSRGKIVASEQARIRKVARQWQVLDQRLQADNLGGLEKAITEEFVKGCAIKTIVTQLNERMVLTPPLTWATTLRIIQKLSGYVDYAHVARLTERAEGAKEILAIAETGNYFNQKAKTTEEALWLLSEHSSPGDVKEELDLGGNRLYALVFEAIAELESDAQGQEDLQEICSNLFGPNTAIASLATQRKSRFTRELISPYRDYRVRIGDKINNSGWLSCNNMSARERDILQAVASGATDKDLSIKFLAPLAYIQIAGDMLLGQDTFVTHVKRLEERGRLSQQFRNSVAGIGKSIPESLLFLDDCPTMFILESLASGKYYREISQELGEDKISIGRLLKHYEVIRAFYAR